MRERGERGNKDIRGKKSIPPFVSHGGFFDLDLVFGLVNYAQPERIQLLTPPPPIWLSCFRISLP